MLYHRTLIPFAVGAALVLGGCGSKQNPSSSATTSSGKSAHKAKLSPTPVAVTGTKRDATRVALAAVYFEYDSAAIRPEYRDNLVAVADQMASRPQMTLSIEGHCDERGTTEYNVALGDLRARAIKDYLVTLGVDEDRISVISYGKERPAVSGSDEQAWARNRRGELKSH